MKLTDNEKYCSCGMGEPETDLHFSECAIHEIERLKGEIKTGSAQFSKHQAEWWDKEERLRAALEAAPSLYAGKPLHQGEMYGRYLDWYDGPRKQALGESK